LAAIFAPELARIIKIRQHAGWVELGGTCHSVIWWQYWQVPPALHPPYILIDQSKIKSRMIKISQSGLNSDYIW